MTWRRRAAARRQIELKPDVLAKLMVSEWSQRSGLTTFTLVPHRGRVITAKAISCVGIAVVSIPLAFGIGALGNIVGTTIAGVDPVWDVTATNFLNIVLANVLGMGVGFMLGVAIRSTPGAMVAYFVYSFLLPGLSLLLAASQDWFRDLQPWVDAPINVHRKAFLESMPDRHSRVGRARDQRCAKTVQARHQGIDDDRHGDGGEDERPQD